MMTSNFDDFLKVQVSMDFKYFISRFKSPSFYYRKLSKSNSSIGGRTNKDFFKRYFSGGYYTFFRTPEKINLFFFLRKTKEITPSMILSLKIRLMKLSSNSTIQIEPSTKNELESWLNMDGIKTILQPIGEDYYKNSRRAEN
jgi:hypothetical protein